MKQKITQAEYDEFLNDAKNQLGLDISEELEAKFEIEDSNDN